MSQPSRKPAILITTLLLLSLTLSIMPTQAANTASGDISSNTEWSGEILLTGDLYVGHGVTLNLKAGTIIDADTYSIVVNGTLTGTDSTIQSTATTSAGNKTTNVGQWPGITVNSGGSTTLTRVAISNAMSGIIVHGTATLDSVELSDSHIGVEADGTVDIDDLECNDVGFECLIVSGTGTVDGLDATNVSVGIASSGSLTVDDVSIQSSGTGIILTGGDGDYTDITMDDVHSGFRIRGTTTSTLDGMTGSGLGLVFDVGDSTGFIVDDVIVECDRAIRGESLDSLTISNSAFNGTRDGSTMVDVNAAGSLTLDNVSFTNASTGLDLRGEGNHILSDVTVEAEDLAVSATGTGTIDAEGLVLDAEDQGMRISGPTLDIDDLQIVGGTETSLGLRLATGSHSIDDLDISRTYSAAETESLGIEMIWATLITEEADIDGFADGILLESSTFESTSTSIEDGRGTGISLETASLSIGTLWTGSHDLGAELRDDSSILIGSWSSNLHSDVMDIDSESTATVRFIEAGNVNAFHALGDGTLVWGSNSTLNLAIGTSHHLTETMIKTVDLSGDALAATVEVEGFTFMTGAPGLVTIPLRDSGSEVVATSGSAGAQTILYGGVADQEMVLPAIPDGNWTITSGNHVVLATKFDGTSHQISGNLTIEAGASLTLQDSSVTLPSDARFTTLGDGMLIGDGGALNGGIVEVDTQAPFKGVGGGLAITSDIFWNCTTPPVVDLLELTGSLSIGDGCTPTLSNSTVSGNPELGSGATLLIQSTLDIGVFDKGEPVVGAAITVSGTDMQTNAKGLAQYTSDAILHDSSGITFAGHLTVLMQSSGLTDLMLWDTNQSLTHTFQASTITPGQLDDWFVMEKAWSPYHLAADLTIAESGTLTLHDGAQLRIASGVEVIVEGAVDAGAGTIQSSGFGVRWAGFTVQGAQSSITLSSTHLVEALLPITMTGGVLKADGAEISRGTDGLISAMSSTESLTIELTNVSMRYGGQNCIRVSGPLVDLTIVDSNMEDCGDHGLWASLADLDITNLLIGSNTGTGAYLAAVEGSLVGLNASGHNGTGASLSITEMDSSFSMRSLHLAPGSASAAMTALQCSWIDVDGMEVSGSPALEIDYSAGSLSSLELSGSGAGTAINIHHNRGKDALSISDSQSNGYSVDLKLHGDEGDEWNQPVMSSGNTWTADISISSDGLPFISTEDDLNAVEYHSDATAESALKDSTYTTLSATGSARLVAEESHSFRFMMFGASLTVDASISIEDPDTGQDFLFSNNGWWWNISLPVHIAAQSGSHQLGSAALTASGPGSLPLSQSLDLTSGERDHILNLTGNTEPLVHISSPDEGEMFSVLENITFIGVASDGQSDASSLFHSWRVLDSGGETVWESLEESPTWEQLEVGEFDVIYTVQDEHGLSTSKSVSFTVRYHDSDGDWTSTCDEEHWFDIENGINCGYDSVDSDDDNDGVPDNLDKWPKDPCADTDADNDGKPDSVDCPSGYDTDLEEDDSVQVKKKQLESSSEGVDTGVLVALMLIIVAGLAVFNRMRSSE